MSDRTKGREEERDRERQRELKRAFKEAVRGKRDPRRSVYFDEVWNPYGIPPPGMPWKERDEDDSEGRTLVSLVLLFSVYLFSFILYYLFYGDANFCRMVNGFRGTENTHAKGYPPNNNTKPKIRTNPRTSPHENENPAESSA